VIRRGVTSAVANLTVMLPLAPIISQHPTNITVTAGGTANFYVMGVQSDLPMAAKRNQSGRRDHE